MKNLQEHGFDMSLPCFSKYYIDEWIFTYQDYRSMFPELYALYSNEYKDFIETLEKIPINKNFQLFEYKKNKKTNHTLKDLVHIIDGLRYIILFLHKIYKNELGLSEKVKQLFEEIIHLPSSDNYLKNLYNISGQKDLPLVYQFFDDKHKLKVNNHMNVLSLEPSKFKIILELCDEFNEINVFTDYNMENAYKLLDNIGVLNLNKEHLGYLKEVLLLNCVLTKMNQIEVKKIFHCLPLIGKIISGEKNKKQPLSSDKKAYYKEVLKDVQSIKQFVAKTVIRYIYDDTTSRQTPEEEKNNNNAAQREKLLQILLSGNEFNGSIILVLDIVKTIKALTKLKTPEEIQKIQFPKIEIMKIPKLFHLLRKVLNCDAKVFKSSRNTLFCDATTYYKENKSDVESKEIVKETDLLNKSIVVSGERTLQFLQLLILHIFDVKDEYKEFTYSWGITDFKYGNDEKSLFWNVLPDLIKK